MKQFDKTWMKVAIVQVMTNQAFSGMFDGTGKTMGYLEACRAIHVPSGTIMIFTRDEGYHSSGWFKNPDYERCIHLSLSFRDPLTLKYVSKDNKLTKEWVDLFFHGCMDKVWAEPPSYEEGKKTETWHYRVFCDPMWQPLLPRGEVYSKEFTEKGWKSFSELKEDVSNVIGG